MRRSRLPTDGPFVEENAMEVEGEQTFGSVQSGMSKLKKAAADFASRTDSKEASDVNKEAAALSDAWIRAGQPQLPDEYEAALIGTAELLRRASPVDAQTLKDVSFDLALKCGHASCAAGAGWGSEPRPYYTKVQVIFEVRSAGKPMTGLYVKGNPFLLRGQYRDPLIAFNNPTNPTTQQIMAPGKYEMWVHTSDNVMLLSGSVEVGLDGPQTKVSWQYDPPK